MKIHQELQAGWDAIPPLDLSNVQEARIQEEIRPADRQPLEMG